jgi:hypothetical protein
LTKMRTMSPKTMTTTMMISSKVHCLMRMTMARKVSCSIGKGGWCRLQAKEWSSG